MTCISLKMMADSNNAGFMEGYLDEPPRHLLPSWDLPSSSDDSSDEWEDIDDDGQVGGRKDWCKCGHCCVWEGQRVMERVCCKDYAEVLAKMGDLDCIVQHQGFKDQCLSEYTIESLIVLFKTSIRSRWKEEFENKAEPHRAYRHMAYCNFVRWVWRTTGRKNRKVLPACLVLAIRDKFPSPYFTGFKYAT